jgi:hypothetical protein
MTIKRIRGCINKNLKKPAVGHRYGASIVNEKVFEAVMISDAHHYLTCNKK